MRATQVRRLDRQLTAFVSELFEGEVRPAGHCATKKYVEGLLLDGARKSIEPMAQRLAADPTDVSALRQSLRYTVAVSPWSEQTILLRVGKKLVDELPALEAYALDDTGFAKKGNASVGVARQYSGTLGRVDNCQVAVSLHVLGEQGSGCIGFRLYLNEDWANDASRREKVGVPEEVEFKEKWRIGLDLLDAALEVGLPRWPMLSDAGYGDCLEFRLALRERELDYGLGILGTMVFWTPGKEPMPPTPKPKGHSGLPRTRWKSTYPPQSALEIATQLFHRKVTWRQGTKGPQRSRFAAIRVRSAQYHAQGLAPGPEEWLVSEWPEGEEKPTKLWLCSLPPGTALKKLIRLLKLRWRIERDYEDLKDELGLDHFEGRMWRGFHHHAALCAIALAFLAIQRTLCPPQPRRAAVDVTDGETGAAENTDTSNRALPPVPPTRAKRSGGSVAAIVNK